MGNKKRNNGEVYPLLTTDWLGTPTYRQKPLGRNIRQEDEEQIEIFEDDDEVFDVVDQKTKRSVNMVWIDVFLLALDFLQILALIQSMSLRWVFPDKWLRNTYYVFGFNADVWEIKKFTDPDVFRVLQGHYITSSSVDIDYTHICYGWFAALGIFGLIYAILHVFIKYRFYPHPRARVFMSRVQFCYITLIHIVSLPIGLAFIRLFECEGDYWKVFVMNQYDCFGTEHWQLAGPAIVVLTILFIAYPGFLAWKIWRESHSGTADGYLTFLLLKETEYKIHLNRAWLFDSMWLFSSFKFRGQFYRPMMQILKLILLIVYTSAFHKIKVQALLTAIMLFAGAVIFLIIRPFRLTSCNAFLVFSLLCNVGNTFVGTLIASYNAYTIPNAWLTADYVIYFIIFVQVAWLFALFFLLVYLLTRTLCHSTKCCYKRPVWPNIASSGSGILTGETKKFMTAIIKAKLAHEKIVRIPAMFAPVHELGRHIQIINTYCREAEYIRDALHMVLWETLDTLVELHAELSPKSLFAASVKKTVRKTATEFMSMVPMFSQRMAQRDYDFILVPPHKKRMLMKMYIMGMFLNGRSEKVAKQKLTDPRIEKVWPPLPENREFEEEDGYYEDLYPDLVRQNYDDDLLDVMVENSTDEELSEEEDNVRGMIQGLPEVGLIDLETLLEQNEVEEEIESTSAIVNAKGPAPKTGPKFGTMPEPQPHARPAVRPTSAASHTSILSQESRPRSSGGSSLFGSQAQLRRDITIAPSLSPSVTRPSSATSTQSGQMLSPHPPPGTPAPGFHPGMRSPGGSRATSASSVHSTRDRSPTARSPMGSVISLQPSQAGSHVSDQELSTVNPGYIPDDEETDEIRTPELRNDDTDTTGYDQPNPDDISDTISTMTSDSGKSDKKKKKRRKNDIRDTISTMTSDSSKSEKKKKKRRKSLKK